MATLIKELSVESFADFIEKKYERFVPKKDEENDEYKMVLEKRPRVQQDSSR